MKIVKQCQRKSGTKCIMNTVLKDEKENIIVIDTCYLSGVGSLLDVFFEGRNTMGEIETMVKLNGYWVNRSQRRYNAEKEALEDHYNIVKLFQENGVNAIFDFNETCVAGFYEDDESLIEMINK